MEDFIHTLGIDWKLLISQIINFAILLVLLRVFVYKPVILMLRRRREKIAEGIERAEEAQTRLREVDEINKEKIKRTEEEALLMMGQTEKKAHDREVELLALAKTKEAGILRDAVLEGKEIKSKAIEEAKGEISSLVKNAIAKITEISPEKIDEALIVQAVREAETEHRA